jgi:hypothetical protein
MNADVPNFQNRMSFSYCYHPVHMPFLTFRNILIWNGERLLPNSQPGELPTANVLHPLLYIFTAILHIRWGASSIRNFGTRRDVTGLMNNEQENWIQA